MTPDDIIATARHAIGTPFQHQGRALGQGMDCVGLPLFIAGRLALCCRDVPAYSRSPENGLLEQAFDEHVARGELLRVPLADIRAGDLLMMRFYSQPQHIAVYTGGTIIHAYQPVGKVCEHRMDAVWRRRIVRAYRFAGVIHE